MSFTNDDKPAWRNGLARWTSNPKVVGSTPTVGAFLPIFLLYVTVKTGTGFTSNVLRNLVLPNNEKK